MKKHLLMLTILLSPAFLAVAARDATTMTEADMRKAAKTMTADEMKNMENFLKKLVKKADTDEEREKREAIFHSFYQGRYDLVMEELKALGENPQKILKKTGLREKMLSGELQRLPWFMQEIAGLDFFFQRDAVAPAKQQKWPKPKDKALYLISLVDQIDRNQNRVEDDKMLKEAIKTLDDKLEDLKDNVPGVFKMQIKMARRKLDDVKDNRGL